MAVVSVVLASAQWTRPTVEVNNDSILDEPTYLYNVGTQMFLTQGNAYGTQGSVAEEGLMIKVEKHMVETGNVTETEEGEVKEYEWDGKCFTIQCFRPVQQKWFYIFIDAAGGLYMDKGNQEDYYWELTKQEDGTWRFSCGAANPTMNPLSYPNTCAGIERVDAEDLSTVVNPLINLDNLDNTHTYALDWNFVTEAAYAVYAEKLTIYNTAMKLKALIDDCNTRSLNTADIQKVYDNTASTLDELNEAVKQAEALISLDDESKVTPDSPKDFSDRIVNPDFDVEVKNGDGGWTKEGTAKTFEINGWVPSTVENVMSAPALNLWGSNQNIVVSQVVENIPNGIYKMNAGVYSQANGPYIFANDSKTGVTTGGPTLYSVLAYVTDRTIKIGVGFPAEGTQWVMADCFRLQYFGNGYEAYKMWINETLSEGDAFADKTCYRPLKEAYTASLAILREATTQEALVAELPNFTVLYDSIKANIAAYDDYNALLAEAWKMILDEAYAGPEFDLLCDYASFESEPDETFPNGTAPYITNNGTLTTEEIIVEKDFLNQLLQNVLDNGMAKGADATIKLVNPNFDNGLNGWTYNKKLGTPSPGGLSANQCVERWNENFDFYQEVSLPNGVYQLSAQAFYRTAGNTTAESEWINETSEVLTYIYANTGETPIVNIYDQAQEAGFYKEDNAYTLTEGTVVPNTMKTASEAFTAGLYENTVVGVVWNGRLRVGIRSLNASATDRWSIWDNFRLTFLGMEAEPIAECYDKTVAEADTLLAVELSEELRAALTEALAMEVDKADGSATLAVIAKIREAMEAASEYTAIDAPSVEQRQGSVVAVYTQDGVRRQSLSKGLNIIRMSNGRVKKVFVR